MLLILLQAGFPNGQCNNYLMHSFGKLSDKGFEKMMQFYTYLKASKFPTMTQILRDEDLIGAFPCDENLKRGNLFLKSVELQDSQILLLLLLESELSRFAAWVNPSNASNQIPDPINERFVKWNCVVRTAWAIDPMIAICMRYRFKNYLAVIDAEISLCSKYSEVKLSDSPEAISFLMKVSSDNNDDHLRV